MASKNVGRVIKALKAEVKRQEALKVIYEVRRDNPKALTVGFKNNAQPLEHYNKEVHEELVTSIEVLQKYMLEEQGVANSDDSTEDSLKKERLNKALDTIWNLVDYKKNHLENINEGSAKKLLSIDFSVTVLGNSEDEANEELLESTLNKVLDLAVSELTEGKKNEPLYETFLSIRLTAERALKD